VNRFAFLLIIALAGCASSEAPTGGAVQARSVPIVPVARGILLPVGDGTPPRLPEVRIARSQEELGKVFLDHLEATQPGLARRAVARLGPGERALLVYAGRKEETLVSVEAIRAKVEEDGTLVITIHDEREPGEPRPEPTHPFFIGRMELGDAPPKAKLRGVDGRPLKWDVWIDGDPR
jgi:hypothetical protein